MNFAVVRKSDNYTVIIKENTELSKYLGVSVQTICKKKSKLSWDWGNYTIYNSQEYIKSRFRGGKRYPKH